MTKTQLIEKIAMETGMTKKAAGEACDALFNGLTEALANGESVQIAGFGTFAAKARPARTCRNPKTGEAIQVPASRAAAFSAGKALKDKLNEA